MKFIYIDGSAYITDDMGNLVECTWDMFFQGMVYHGPYATDQWA